MAKPKDSQLQGMPKPEPALHRLDRLVGKWKIEGHLAGSDVVNIIGKADFQWLEGGFFLQQDVVIDFAGMVNIKSHELIGFDPESNAFSSRVYSNISPEALPYKWDIQGDTISISVSYGTLDARFKGKFDKDDEKFTGGWRPNPGADPIANVAYDLEATRQK